MKNWQMRTTSWELGFIVLKLMKKQEMHVKSWKTTIWVSLHKMCFQKYIRTGLTHHADALTFTMLVGQYGKDGSIMCGFQRNSHPMSLKFHICGVRIQLLESCLFAALGFYDRASDMYMENGTPDTAALCLERAGKSVELINSDWAIEMFMKVSMSTGPQTVSSCELWYLHLICTGRWHLWKRGRIKASPSCWIFGSSSKNTGKNFFWWRNLRKCFLYLSCSLSIAMALMIWDCLR